MDVAAPSAELTKPARLHYLDGARAALMIFGIPYHSAQFYTERPWYVRSAINGGTVEYIGNFLHLFRMHAFYVVAGIFAAMLLERRKPLSWLKGRAQRLLIPLVFATVVILPIQDSITDLLNGGNGLLPYYNIAALKLPSASQTWFLRHLFGYSCCIAAAYAMFKVTRYTVSISRPTAYLLSLVFVIFASATTSAIFFALHAAGLSSLIGEGLKRFVFYAPFFLGGALLWLVPSFFTRFVDGRAHAVGIMFAVLALGALALLPRDTVGTFPQAAAAYLGGLIGTWLTLNLAFRYLDQSNPIVDFYVDGALTIYLTHMLFAIGFGILIVDRLGNSIAEWLLIVILTFASSTVFYAIVRKIPILYYVFNGQFRKPPRRHSDPPILATV